MGGKKIILGVILVLILAFSVVYFDQRFEPNDIKKLRELANSQTDVLPPKEFTTDGCSLWPNSFFGSGFTDVCIEHDIKYWKGGSAEERKMADNELKEGVNERVPFMGSLMYFGVRIFGHPIVPAPWRWGYGFEYPYTY